MSKSETRQERSRRSTAELVALYAADLKRRNYADRTIYDYKKSIAYFMQHAGTGDVRAIIRRHLTDYILHLAEAPCATGKPYAVKTRIYIFTALRAFFRYLAKRNYILADPAEALPAMQEPSTLPRKILSRDEMIKVLAQPDTRTPFGFRDRAILELIYSTALRRREVTELTIYDVDFAAGMVRVLRGKGGKGRIVPIGKVALKYVLEYVRRIRPMKVKDPAEKALLLDKFGQRMKPATLSVLVREYIKKAGVWQPGLACHAFRHTCATEMLRGGSSVRYVQEMLGHADISSTQLYTRVLPLDLQRATRRAHPRERKRIKEAPASPLASAVGAAAGAAVDAGARISFFHQGKRKRSRTSRAGSRIIR